MLLNARFKSNLWFRECKHVSIAHKNKLRSRGVIEIDQPGWDQLIIILFVRLDNVNDFSRKKCKPTHLTLKTPID